MAKYNKEKNCIELGPNDVVVSSGGELLLYTGIRCRNCGYYHMKHMVCNRPFEHPVMRGPDDFCSGATRRIANEPD